MNVRSILLVVVALAVAGVTAIMARSWLGANQAQPVQVVAAPQSSTKILVAAVNMPIGRIVEAEDLRWQSWPDDAVSENYLKQGVVKIESLLGKVVRHGMTIGEPVTQLRLVGPGERGFMAAILSPGMRAITVPINATSGIAGFIFPGDRVDLILTHSPRDGDGKQRRASETVMRNVRILAVDTRTNDQTTTPALGKTVTIEVTPKIVEKIAVLQRVGAISLSLRSLAKPDGQPTTAMTLDDSKPDASTFTHTWDAEVSSLLPPVDASKEKHVVNVTRQAKQESITFKRQKK